MRKHKGLKKALKRVGSYLYNVSNMVAILSITLLTIDGLSLFIYDRKWIIHFCISAIVLRICSTLVTRVACPPFQMHTFFSTHPDLKLSVEKVPKL